MQLSSALESEERDIKYIAGFVTFRCIKKCVSSTELNKYFEKFIDKIEILNWFLQNPGAVWHSPYLQPYVTQVSYNRICL